MINLMLGAPGGGKSYEACVFHILPALQRGRKVITNLPVNEAMFAALEPGFAQLLEVRRSPQPVRGTWAAGTDGPAFRVEGEPVPQDPSTRLFSTVWDYWTDWRHPSGMGPLFVIDECQLALPRIGTDPHVSEWFSLHRHYNADVLLLTQSYGRLNADIRDLVQLVYRVRKAVAFGMPDKYIRKVQDGIRGEVVNTAVRKYESRYFPLYKSHTQGSSVGEEDAQDRRPIWMAWPFLGVALCVVLSILLAWSSTKKPAPPVPKATQPPAWLGESLTPAQRADIARSAEEFERRHELGKPAVAVVPADLPSPAAPPAIEPYGNRGLHLTGSMTRPDGSQVWMFAVSQQGSYLHALADADLKAAGYSWRPLAPCAGELSFGKSVRAVICDSPQVSLALGSPGSAVRTASVSPLSPLGGAAPHAAGGTPLAGGTRGERSEP